MLDDNTPGTGAQQQPLDPTSESRRWRNDEYPYYIVQALQPEHALSSPKALLEEPCDGGEQCPGTHRSAFSGVCLARRDALHALRHYGYANQSICRFKSNVRAEYAVDLTVDIDAHDRLPSALRKTTFDPYIAAAVEAGRIWLDWLIGFGVWPGFITTSVTRMGARVTVDWRAFGPRRVHEVVTVARHIQCLVFAEGQLEAIAAKHVVPTLEVDLSPYKCADHPRADARGENTFKGKWLRPTLALHSRSRDDMWFRTVAVPHDRFRVEHAGWLVDVSRNAGTHNLEIFDHKLVAFNRRVPEAREPRWDHLVEQHPLGVECLPLVDLFERADVLEVLPEHRDEIDAAWRRSNGCRITRREFDVKEEDVLAIADELGTYRRHGNKVAFETCPRAQCRGRHSKWKTELFLDNGQFHCYKASCDRSIPIHDLAREDGCSHLLTLRRQSSRVSGLVPVSGPVSDGDPWQGADYQVIDREFDTVEALCDDRGKAYDDFMRDERATTLLDLSQTGTGKTSTTIRLLKGLAAAGRPFRVFVPRTESATPYLEELPSARFVRGRTAKIAAHPDPVLNCRNKHLEMVSSNWEPIAQTLCNEGCEHFGGCTYLRQFEELEGQSLVLNHPYAMRELKAIKNDSVLDVVDEDPITYVGRHVELNAKDLERLKTDLRIEVDPLLNESMRADPELRPYADDISADDARLVRGPSNSRIDRLITGLARCLERDHVAGVDLRYGQEPLLGDRDLARVMFARPDVTEAVDTIADDDVDLIEAQGAELSALYRASDGVQGPDERLWPPKRVFRQLVTALRDAAYAHRAGRDFTSALQLVRSRGRWVYHLSERHEFLPGSRKIIILSATLTPERLRLLGREWGVTVYRASLPKREERIVVCDQSFSTSALHGAKSDAKRARLFETLRAVIDGERTRTGLPVALLGTSKTINAFNAWNGVEARLRLPFPAEVREERFRELKSRTVALGYIPGLVHSVSGSNGFEVDGQFCRVAVVLHAIPNLTDFARVHRGLFAGLMRDVEEPLMGLLIPEPIMVDWTQTFRSVAWPCSELNGLAWVAHNVCGYRDPIANELLLGAYQGGALQALGRIRSGLVTSGETPRVYLFGPLPLPRWPVDHWRSLEEVRDCHGLDAKKVELTPVTLQRIRKHGVWKLMRKAIEQIFKRYADHDRGRARDVIRRHWAEHDLTLPDGWDAYLDTVWAELLASDPASVGRPVTTPAASIKNTK